MTLVPQIKGVHPSLGIVLDGIAHQIKDQQILAAKAAYSAIECWMNIGELLTEAKLKCSHGSWLLWLKSSVNISSRQAQRYMRAWDNRNEIFAKIESGEDFQDLDLALKAICPPEKTRSKSDGDVAFEENKTFEVAEEAEEEVTLDVTEEASDIEQLLAKGIEVQTDQVDDPHGHPQAVYTGDLDEFSEVDEVDEVIQKSEKSEVDEVSEKSEELIKVHLSGENEPLTNWLKVLPLTKVLRGRPLKLFTADAIVWRNTEKLREEALHAFESERDKASELCGMKRCEGRFTSTCRNALDVWNPRFWAACPECSGIGDDVAGLCRRCGGYGYLTI